MTPELKRLAMIAAPAALAGGVVQVNLLVGRQIASYFEGANAWLYYADRLVSIAARRGGGCHWHCAPAGSVAAAAHWG